ncbi:LacI family transcriptional regulator [Opitutaceae bacterium TAV4]|nr:LacI family transcriptional regulator [Opitutaceae bacterium TAV4]RRK02778.1 LacI family transcriptional regulator [Opitutaceae bacterium TAV3]
MRAANLQPFPFTGSSVVRPRLSDIAREARVSIGTVSRVLNGKTDVAAVLTERVLGVARSLGYTRRMPARAGGGTPAVSAPGQTGGSRAAVIGYLVDTPDLPAALGDTFLQQILGGIEDGVNRNEGHLLFATCGAEVAQGRLPAMVAENRVEGVVLKRSPETPEAWIRKLAEVTPVVMLMNSSEDRAVFSVMCDNYAAVYQVLHYLRGLGHRRVGFLSVDDVGWRASVLHRERLDAFRQYAGALGCAEHPAYVQLPRRDHVRETLSDAVGKALKNWFALPSGERPTGVVCATDSYAFSVLALAGRHGIEVPRDLSVVGCMNTDMCEHSSPPLTSVSLSGDEVGRVAVNLLCERLQNPTMLVRHVSVGTRLVERLSCASVSDS